jgi:hypothetical protein
MESKKIMRKIIFLSVIFSLAFAGNLTAQWSFNYRFHIAFFGYGGSAANNDQPTSWYKCPIDFPTKAQCEMERNQLLLSKGRRMGDIINTNEGPIQINEEHYYECTPCMGRDLATGTGAIEMQGVDRGSANFSPNASESEKYWQSQYSDRMLAFNSKGGNLAFNDYQNAMKEENDFNFDRSSRYLKAKINATSNDDDKKKGGRAGALGGFIANPSASGNSGLGAGQMAQAAIINAGEELIVRESSTFFSGKNRSAVSEKNYWTGTELNYTKTQMEINNLSQNFKKPTPTPTPTPKTPDGVNSKYDAKIKEAKDRKDWDTVKKLEEKKKQFKDDVEKNKTEYNKKQKAYKEEHGGECDACQKELEKANAARAEQEIIANELDKI